MSKYEELTKHKAELCTYVTQLETIQSAPNLGISGYADNSGLRAHRRLSSRHAESLHAILAEEIAFAEAELAKVNEKLAAVETLLAGE